MSQHSRTVTTVGIVGAGPAGLMLSHLLSLDGIDSVVVDNRTRREVEDTVRAGILERDSVRLLVESGVSDRVLTEGHEHAGIDLRFGGVSAVLACSRVRRLRVPCHSRARQLLCVVAGGVAGPGSSGLGGVPVGVLWW